MCRRCVRVKQWGVLSSKKLGTVSALGNSWFGAQPVLCACVTATGEENSVAKITILPFILHNQRLCGTTLSLRVDF
jgi:hypothetical protein